MRQMARASVADMGDGSDDLLEPVEKCLTDL